MSKPSILSLDGPYKDGGSYILRSDRGVMFIDHRFGHEHAGTRGRLVWGVKEKTPRMGYHGYDMGPALSAAECAIYQPLIDRYVNRLSARRVKANCPPVVIRTAWRAV